MLESTLRGTAGAQQMSAQTQQQLQTHYRTATLQKVDVVRKSFASAKALITAVA
jgi:hypothetical protein